MTGITITRKKDGHWLNFKSSKGNAASLRVESLRSKFGYVTWKAIMEWAEEQAKMKEEEPAIVPDDNARLDVSDMDRDAMGGLIGVLPEPETEEKPNE